MEHTKANNNGQGSTEKPAGNRHCTMGFQAYMEQENYLVSGGLIWSPRAYLESGSLIWRPAALMQEVPLHLLDTLLRQQRHCSQGYQR